ncbi:MAG: O-antigen ligase family protein [Clostridia bacterium]|nr:O-antigen ligase family protein [Clostridia bacterium]
MTYKINSRGIIEYLLLLLIFINGQSVWIRFIDGNRFILMAWIVSGITSILLLSYRTIPKSTLIKSAIIIVYQLFYIVATRHTSYTNSYLYRFMIVFALFFLLGDALWRKGKMRQFVLKFANIVCLFALISLVLYLFGTCLNLLSQSVDSYDWAKVTKNTVNYFHLMYEAQTSEILGITVVRNCGIFAEVPSYAVPLLLGLFLELFIRERIMKINVIILIITIVTTFSSKAISIALVVIALKLCVDVYFIRKKIKGWKGILKIVLPILLLFMAAVALEIVSTKLDTSSGFMRLDNIYTGWKAFRSNPLFGVGFDNEDALNTYASYMTSSGGLAMGIPVLIGEGGLYLILFYIYGMVRFVKNIKNNLVALSFVLVHILILFTSNIPYFLSTMLILAIEYSIPNIKARKREIGVKVATGCVPVKEAKYV